MKNTIKLTFTFADGRVETQVLDKPDGAPVRVAVPSGAKVDVEVLSPESDGAKSESAADAQAVASEHAIQFTKVGQDLVVEDAGEQLLELVDFYATPDVTMGSVWWDYAELLSQATSSEMVASEAMQASASTGAGEAAAAVEGSAPGFSPALFAGLGALALGGGGGTAAVSNVVSGLFVAGPAVTGHSLEVSLFDTNGTLLGGPTKLGADGSFSFDVGSYTGRVIAQLVDTDDTTSDYFDEATGVPVDLTTPMLAIGTTADGATTLNINVLTTMAAKQAGVVASSSASTSPDVTALNDSLFDSANTTVAGWFGLNGDASQIDTTPVVDSSGALNANASDLGKVLAALSGIDALNSQGTQATIDSYVTPGSGTPIKSPSAMQADLIQGAARVEGEMTMGSLIACSILSGRVLQPVMQIPTILSQHANSLAALEGLEKVYQLETDHHGVPRPLLPSSIGGNFTIKDLAFGYPGGEAALQIPALQIRQGERIGILGPIGSGKSTLLRLLSGLYRAQMGQITLDNMDLKQIDRTVLANHIGYLQQEHRLFQGSLRENLLVGMTDPGDDAIKAALEKSGMIGMVLAHPRGLDLPIHEGGNGLSGGQKQLVAFTRLLLCQPDVWLLDEPTASMDGAQESLCLNALGEATRDKTVVVVTHKPSVLPLVDRIIVIAAGKIVMDDSKQSVLEKLAKGELQVPRHHAASSQPVQEVAVK